MPLHRPKRVSALKSMTDWKDSQQVLSGFLAKWKSRSKMDRFGSARAATPARYVGEEGTTLVDAEGFVDTGDMVEQRGDRCYFLGRRSGVINVGGLKVYPEEVEALLNRHPAVRMSCVRSRRNPITGALVVADIVLKDEGNLTGGKGSALEQEILKICRDTLPRHKVPTTLRFVPALAVAESGKMVRPNA